MRLSFLSQREVRESATKDIMTLWGSVSNPVSSVTEDVDRIEVDSELSFIGQMNR